MSILFSLVVDHVSSTDTADPSHTIFEDCKCAVSTRWLPWIDRYRGCTYRSIVWQLVWRKQWCGFWDLNGQGLYTNVKFRCRWGWGWGQASRVLGLGFCRMALDMREWHTAVGHGDSKRSPAASRHTSSLSGRDNIGNDASVFPWRLLLVAGWWWLVVVGGDDKKWQEMELNPWP